MRWFASYHDNLLADMKQKAPLFISVDKLQALWPLLVGGTIFALFDLGIGLSGAVRWLLLVVFLSPGVVWALYITVLELRFVVLAWRARKNGYDRGDLNG